MNSLIRPIIKTTLAAVGVTLVAVGTVLTVTRPEDPPYPHDPDDPLSYY